jgi:hypothetical protein
LNVFVTTLQFLIVTNSILHCNNQPNEEFKKCTTEEERCFAIIRFAIKTQM